MVSLKRLLAATAVATAGLVGVAQAQTAPAPQLTDDEKATVKLYHDFKACTAAKAPAFEAAVEANDAKATAKATEVVKASEAAVRDAATKAGLTKEEADGVLEGMAESVVAAVAAGMNKALVRPGTACIAEMKIDIKDAQTRVNTLVKKYGPDVFAKPN